MNKRHDNFLVYRILCFLMAIHVINISLDTPDMSSLSGRATAYHKDLSVNKLYFSKKENFCNQDENIATAQDHVKVLERKVELSNIPPLQTMLEVTESSLLLLTQDLPYSAYWFSGQWITEEPHRWSI